MNSHVVRLDDWERSRNMELLPLLHGQLKSMSNLLREIEDFCALLFYISPIVANNWANSRKGTGLGTATGGAKYLL